MQQNLFPEENSHSVRLWFKASL